ncbi:MAG: M13 family metallopeptidase [Minicystis sp.]
MNRTVLLGAAVVLALGACESPEPVRPVTAPPPAAAPHAGLDESLMDPAANPCRDLYRYACGGWMDHTEIPSDQPIWSRAHEQLDRINRQVRDLLQSAAAGRAPAGAVYAGKLGDFYGTCMDEAAVEATEGDLKAAIARLAAIRDARSLAVAAGELHALGATPLFELDPANDAKDARLVIADLGQGGIGLPDRDLYLNEAEKPKAIRALYRDYVTDLFKLLGEPADAAARDAAAVITIETALARASLSRAELRDPERTYHRLERAGLKQKAPGFDWDAFLDAAGAKSVQAINVEHPPFAEAVSDLARSTPPEAFRAYLTRHLLRALTPALPRRFRDAAFAFARKLNGAAADPPRYRTCVQLATQLMPDAVGQAFIAAHFSPGARAATRELIEAVEQSFTQDLAALGWMDAPTKQSALAKAKSLVNKIGYPDRFRSYDGLTTSRPSFFGNLVAARRFEHARQVARIGAPEDRAEWDVPVTAVIAAYDPQKHEMMFPAAILQPPIFDPLAPRLAGFASMGTIVGHEITHGFDDEGRKYDEKGNLRSFWSEASAKAFNDRAACVKQQFDEAPIAGGSHLNGALTLGENVADLGGLKLSFAAMKRWLAAHPEDGKGSRFTPEQQFFLTYAQVWCAKQRPEHEAMAALTDPHAPPRLRVEAPLQNLTEFRDAFQCKAGDPMVRPAEKRCEVW